PRVAATAEETGTGGARAGRAAPSAEATAGCERSTGAPRAMRATASAGVAGGACVYMTGCAACVVLARALATTFVVRTGWGGGSRRAATATVAAVRAGAASGDR